MFCEYCGAQVSTSALYCRQCGRRVVGVDPEGTPESVSVAPALSDAPLDSADGVPAAELDLSDHTSAPASACEHGAASEGSRASRRSVPTRLLVVVAVVVLTATLSAALGVNALRTRYAAVSSLAKGTHLIVLGDASGAADYMDLENLSSSTAAYVLQTEQASTNRDSEAIAAFAATAEGMEGGAPFVAMAAEITDEALKGHPGVLAAVPSKAVTEITLGTKTAYVTVLGVFDDRATTVKWQLQKRDDIWVVTEISSLRIDGEADSSW